MTNKDQVREAFEQWATINNFDLDIDDGQYEATDTNAAWTAWQVIALREQPLGIECCGCGAHFSIQSRDIICKDCALFSIPQQPAPQPDGLVERKLEKLAERAANTVVGMTAKDLDNFLDHCQAAKDCIFDALQAALAMTQQSRGEVSEDEAVEILVDGYMHARNHNGKYPLTPVSDKIERDTVKFYMPGAYRHLLATQGRK